MQNAPLRARLEGDCYNRPVALASPVLEALRRAYERRSGESVLGASRTTLHRWLHDVALSAGVRELSPHAGRHFLTSFLLASGVPLAEVAALLGHQSSATTLGVYDHDVGADKQAPGAVDGLFSPPDPPYLCV